MLAVWVMVMVKLQQHADYNEIWQIFDHLHHLQHQLHPSTIDINGTDNILMSKDI